MKSRTFAILGALVALVPCSAFAEWKVETQKSPLDGSMGVAVWVEAKDTVQLAGGKTVRPDLTFQCLQRRFTVLFDAKSKFALDSAGPRSVKLFMHLDDGPIFEKILGQTFDGRSASAYDSSFARQLMKGKKLTIDWTPADGTKTSSEFDFAGFDDVKGQLETACKIKF